MEINSLNEALNRQSGGQSADLLRQLKAAGSVEAVVVKLLQDKLLLSSRLGEILTSNTLNYRPGDKLRLRLDDSGGKPVLKASREPSRPVEIPASANPGLKRALVPDRPVLAEVLRQGAATTEIRLRGEPLQLPRRLPVLPGELVSLLRDDRRDRIEISALDKKPIYKALIQKLLPPTSNRSDASLVRLVELVRAAVAEEPPARGAQPVAEPNRSPLPKPLELPPTQVTQGAKSPSKSAAIAAGGGQVAPLENGASQPQPATTKFPAEAPAKARPAAARVQPAVPAESVLQNPPTARPAPSARGDTVSSIRAQTAIPPSTNPPSRTVTPAPAATRANTGSVASVPPARPEGGAGIKPATAAAPASKTMPAVAAGPISATASIPSTPTQAVSAANQISSQAPVAPDSQPAPTVSRLLEWLPRLGGIQPSDLLRWLEISGLSNPRPNTPANIDPARILLQLTDHNLLNRELEQLSQIRAQSTVGEQAANKAPSGENLLPLLREGAKLIEQSLVQNVLQRASAGLQQETQQPLNLSFALPVIDQQTVKPLQIELNQRGQAAAGDEQSWDIRICFEFADLGPVSCHLFLQGTAVAASFYADRDSTREVIEQGLPELRQQLSLAGFDPGELHSFAGHRAPPPQASAGYAEALIDIEV